MENGVTLDCRAILQPLDDARDIGPGSVTKLASDEGAVGAVMARDLRADHPEMAPETLRRADVPRRSG